jgi:hypothetical protein
MIIFSLLYIYLFLPLIENSNSIKPTISIISFVFNKSFIGISTSDISLQGAKEFLLSHYYRAGIFYHFNCITISYSDFFLVSNGSSNSQSNKTVITKIFKLVLYITLKASSPSHRLATE